MKILVADDEPVQRLMLEGALKRLGYEVVVASDGVEALDALRPDDAPQLAIVDWMMPELDGLGVCRQLRSAQRATPVYVILLTSKSEKADIVTGLEAGADEYITKPFDQEELRARVLAGTRIVNLQNSLAGRVAELQKALARVKRLQGLLPICAYCKRIRDDGNYWQEVEEYISAHSESRFTHGICPECMRSTVMPQVERFLQEIESKE